MTSEVDLLGHGGNEGEGIESVIVTVGGGGVEDVVLLITTVVGIGMTINAVWLAIVKYKPAGLLLLIVVVVVVVDFHRNLEILDIHVVVKAELI